MDPVIRLASLADAAAICEIYAPFCENTPVSFETEAPSVDEMRRRISKTFEKLPWLVYERDGLIIGYAYASPHRERAAYRWSVDVSAYVREGHRRSGVGRLLYSKLFEIVREQGYFTAIAGITLPNPGSVCLHEAMGFELIGVYRNIGYKCGKWHDVAWYQLALGDYVAEPAEPHPIRQKLDQI